MPTKGKTYYKVKHLNDPSLSKESVQITKFNQDLEVESSYPMNFIENARGGYYDCQCPASKFDCRHKSILKAFQAAGEIDGERFYCFETKNFTTMQNMDA